MTVLLVALGGAAGALARYAIDARMRGTFPLGILVVNVAGSLGLGVLVGAAATGHASTAVGGGLLGAFTTYSTFAHDLVALAEQGYKGAIAANLVGTLGGGLLAAWAGLAIGRAL